MNASKTHNKTKDVVEIIRKSFDSGNSIVISKQGTILYSLSSFDKGDPEPWPIAYCTGKGLPALLSRCFQKVVLP